MSAQLAIQKTLNEALLHARMRNPAYSLRAFARRLDLSPASVSEILNGKRRISKKIAAKIAVKLGLDPEQAQLLLAQFPSTLAAARQATISARTEERLELSMDHFRAISDWWHFAILSLAETREFRDDPEWIATRLKVRTLEIRSALERLERLGMLERDPSGKLKATGISYRSSDEIANLALRKAQFQNLELSRQSLESDPVEVRDFTAMTLAIDPQKLPAAKKMVRAFMNELCSFLESGEQREVYKFCTQLIPLTKQRENDHD